MGVGSHVVLSHHGGGVTMDVEIIGAGSHDISRCM